MFNNLARGIYLGLVAFMLTACSGGGGGTLESGQSVSDSIGKDEPHYYRIEVPEGASMLTASIQSEKGWPTVYVRYNEKPTEENHGYRNACWSDPGEAPCEVPDPEAGTYHLAVVGYVKDQVDYSLVAEAK